MDKIKRLAIAFVILALAVGGGLLLLPKHPPGYVPYAQRTTPGQPAAATLEEPVGPGSGPAAGDNSPDGDLTPMPE